MQKCQHKIVYYLGIQHTFVKNKFLYLCTCIHCGSTIAIPKKFISDTTGHAFYNSS